ncbi:hypothetical protein Rhe02_03850 [Rhizocola hellebori]|uniref:ABC3 transporter permease C-terminal domain-containing protein n=1 Tax=Rhizocola hellebori TaxID=1392758 RepID=A0A8J3Q2N8_9ACTN|nr:FtsX-like permease family protein [Rhizocola hellebori]GIH02318.1 hypothetical protein Rhe02_03850 [Rhizocola hellebori]
MNLLLGIRMVLGGGRESMVRMALMAIGIAIGVLLVLLALTALPVLQTHTDRLAWHRTNVNSPATAPDPALWLAVTDRYAGKDVIRVHVAALGAHPPVPPGISRLPGPGEVFVSPALAELMAATPSDQLRDRFPGRIAGTIGPEGLIAPAELVGIVGQAPQQLRQTLGATEIRGIEQPGERRDLIELLGILVGMLAALIIGPVAVFVAMVTRLGGARRDVRFAALRLAGATRWQTAVFAAVETVGAAIAGVLLGWAGFLAVRPLAAGYITLGHGMPIFASDLRVPTGQLVLVLLAVPLLAGATTLVSLRPVQMTPLQVRRRTRRRPPSAWRLLPVAVGLLGVWAITKAQANPALAEDLRLGPLSLLAALSIVVGLFLSGSWVCMWISRGMARLSGSATSLIVARRVAADPYSTFRAVSGAALAIYVATWLSLSAAHERQTQRDVTSALDPGVVAVHVQGASPESVAALMSGDAVMARVGPNAKVVVACAELARVTSVRCPLPTDPSGWDTLEGAQAEDLFMLPYPGVSAADYIFGPRAFAEPDAESAQLPIQTLFIPTDGTLATQERLRTLAAVTIPASRSKTDDDLPAREAVDTSGLDAALPPVMVFVLLVAACSLTVSAINGLTERRRPFALLRASGVRLGELRRIVLLETGVPLAATVLGGVGVAMVAAYVSVSPSEWVWPTGGFLAGLGVGVLAAFAVSLIALPLMDIATRHDSIRFE